MHQLFEALEYKDLEHMMKPTLHVDEFAAKMGDDDEIIVVSFFVRSKLAAKDLVSWFEKGYDWILDADQSPGELKPGRYLVFIEMKRRSSAGKWLAELVDDLSTLTEYKPNDWTMHYEGKEYPFNQDTFDNLVPLSPKTYREIKETKLNRLRESAGLDPKKIYDVDRELRILQAQAGI